MVIFARLSDVEQYYIPMSVPVSHKQIQFPSCILFNFSCIINDIHVWFLIFLFSSYLIYIYLPNKSDDLSYHQSSLNKISEAVLDDIKCRVDLVLQSASRMLSKTINTRKFSKHTHTHICTHVLARSRTHTRCFYGKIPIIFGILTNTTEWSLNREIN